jgi:hypothetical protein
MVDPTDKQAVDRAMLGIGGAVILLWLAFAVYFYHRIMTPPMDGPMFILAGIMAAAAAGLAVFVVALIAIGILWCAAAVLK